MDHKIPGKYYLVEVPGWNGAGFAIAEYRIMGGKSLWFDISERVDNCTDYVISYKALDKVGKMHPFAVLTVKNN